MNAQQSSEPMDQVQLDHEPIDLSLLPTTAELSDQGRLLIGGCDLVGLADELGTPLFVYDEKHLRDRCHEYRQHFGDGVTYAGKAFLCQAMVRLIDEEGLRLDVATGGELYVALSANFPPERIVFHGNNKSSDELDAALVAGVGWIVVDSLDELDRIEALIQDGAEQGRMHEPANVLVRVTPGVEAHTHAYIETGIEDSKFGFTITTGAALEACTRVAASPSMRLAGLHCHIGSQIFVLNSYARAAQVVAQLAAKVEAATGQTIGELNLGGGLGARYHRGEEPPLIAEYATNLRAALTSACSAAGLQAEPHLAVEPGRSIAAQAGVTLYRVGTIKHIPGVRTYLAVDGGMSDNVRPATYGALYETFLPDRVAQPRPKVVTVAGKHCEQGDVLVTDATLPADVHVGDVLCTPTTGAYGYAMASNYNKVTRPAVVFVNNGTYRVVVRRETPEDLIRLDVGPNPSPNPSPNPNADPYEL